MAKKPTDVVTRLAALFAGYEAAHGTHGMPERDINGLKWSIKKTAKTLATAATPEMWEEHVKGKRPLGIVPIRSDNTCLWGSIDVDKYNLDLLEIVETVENLKLPLVPCRSKSGGLHLFLFLKEPVEAAAVQLALRNLAATLGFADSEVFPKQTKILAEQGDSGSWMVMPYFGDTYGGKLKTQHGLKRTGAEQTLTEFVTFAEKARISEADLAAIRQRSIPAEEGGSAKANGKKKGGGKPSVPFGDGPPCLQFMSASGFPEGGRNNALFMIGLYLKRADPLNWKNQLEQDNARFMRPPLPAEEVAELKKQLEKKEYEYKCKDQPMVNHCDSALCRSRRFGVGNEYVPHIVSMRKVMSDPVIWFLDVDGGPHGAITLSMKTEDLERYDRFQSQCADTATVRFCNLSNQAWNNIVADAMNNRTDTFDPPVDLTSGGRFGELMETFLTNRARGTKREDLLRGVPWEDEDSQRHYFRLADLHKFLEREGLKLNRSEITHNIKRMHNSINPKTGLVEIDRTKDPEFYPKVAMRVKDRHVNAWWVPSNTIQAATPIDPPAMPKEKI